MTRSFLLAAIALGTTGFAAARPVMLDARAEAAAVYAPPAAALEVMREADGLFYVHATVNGARVRFLVDTGANYTVLTHSDAARIGVTKDARFDGAVETAGGQRPMAWATLREVRFAGREIKGMKAAVVRDGLEVSLLGQNMLAELDQVTIERDRLLIR